MLPPSTFQSAEHEPFHWQAGRAAALLVHGFPGTPAEMRPLGMVLHRAGWTVHGLLLPGFGPQLESLPARRASDWASAVREKLAELQTQHRPVLLVGYSLGGALALQAAASHRPDGLVLLSPFWQIDHILWRMLPVFKFIFPSVKPFKLLKLDFKDPNTRAGIANFMPGADLDDPAVRQAVRDFRLPVGLFDQIRAAGQDGYRAAAHIQTPTLIIQGTHDDLVRASTTRRLLARLQCAADYIEVPAKHDLPDSANGAWTRIEHSFIAFASRLLAETRGEASIPAPAPTQVEGQA